MIAFAVRFVRERSPAQKKMQGQRTRRIVPPISSTPEQFAQFVNQRDGAFAGRIPLLFASEILTSRVRIPIVAPLHAEDRFTNGILFPRAY